MNDHTPPSGSDPTPSPLSRFRSWRRANLDQQRRLAASWSVPSFFFRTLSWFGWLTFDTFWLRSLFATVWWKLALAGFWLWLTVSLARSARIRLRQGWAPIPLPPKPPVVRPFPTGPHPASQVGRLDAGAWCAIVAGLVVIGYVLFRTLSGAWIVLDPLVLLGIVLLGVAVRRRALGSDARASRTEGHPGMRGATP